MNATATPASVITPATNDAPPPVVEAITPTPEQWQAFLDAIVEGSPTTGLLPAALSKLTLTDEQREELRAARKDNALFAQQNRKLIHRLTSRKCYAASSVKFAKNANVTLRFGATDKKAAARAVTEFRARLANA